MNATRTTGTQFDDWTMADVDNLKQGMNSICRKIEAKRMIELSDLDRREIVDDAVSGFWFLWNDANEQYVAEGCDEPNFTLLAWRAVHRAFDGRSIVGRIAGRTGGRDVNLKACAKLSLNGLDVDWAKTIDDAFWNDLLAWLPNSPLTLRQQQILAHYAQRPHLKQLGIARKCGISVRHLRNELQVIRKAMRKAEFV